MSIEYRDDTAYLNDVIAVEEAETLLEWIQTRSQPKIDMSSLEHIHTACLQVLMAAKPQVVGWPEDNKLKDLLRSALGG